MYCYRNKIQSKKEVIFSVTEWGPVTLCYTLGDTFQIKTALKWTDGKMKLVMMEQFAQGCLTGIFDGPFTESEIFEMFMTGSG